MKKTIVLLCLACGLVLGSCIPASYSFGTLHKHLMDIRSGMSETEIISLTFFHNIVRCCNYTY